MFKEFLTGPSVVTGDDLLTKMSSVCKAEDVRDAYVNCSTVISSPFCPGLVNIRDYVTRNINERLKLFCDSKQTATWLLEALHNSFIFNIKCLQPNNPVISIVYNCFSEALKSEDTKGFLELPVDQALPLLQIINRDVFWCAINRANDEFKDNHAKLECGSTWQDIFLGFWVFRTAGDTFGPVIEKPEMEVLKVNSNGKYGTGLLTIPFHFIPTPALSIFF